MAGEIARCLAELVVAATRRRCACCSARAPAAARWPCMPADRVICAQHSWLSPLPPEGAVGDPAPRPPTGHPRWPQQQRVRSLDLLEAGIVDRDRRRAPGCRRRARGVPRRGSRR